MIKKIATKQLKPGMYVNDINSSWLNHPFLKSSFQLTSDKEIEKIVHAGIREVYIDTDKGVDDSNAPTIDEVRKEFNQNIKRELSNKAADGAEPTMAVEQEINKAHRVFDEANSVVHQLMDDVRLGKQIEIEQTRNIVEQISSSVFRNPDALIYLSRIKQADQYTFLHSISVSVLMVAFARFLKMPEPVIKEIGMGALLHDIGKMRVPQDILNKPGKLAEEEFTIMKDHVLLGLKIAQQNSEVSKTALEVLSQHHERVDGSGYPLRLPADKLSQHGKMAAIVDVYDALSSDRVYHARMEPTDTMRKIVEWSKHHLDEQLVLKFVRCIGIYPVGTLVRMESGRVAVVTERNATNPLLPKVRVIYDGLHNHYIAPYELDVANEVKKGNDKIVGSESARRLNIKAQAFL